MHAGRSILYFLAVAAPRIGMFAVIFALARVLPVDEVGLFVLVVTVGELLEMVAANWVRIYVQNREAGNARISALRAGRMVAITCLVTLLATLAAFPVAHIVGDERWRDFALAASAYVIAFGVLRYALGVLQTLRRHEDFARVEFVRAVTILLAIVVVAWIGPKSYLMPSLALSLTTLLVALWGVWLTSRFVDAPRFTLRGFKAAAAFGLPMMGDTLLAYLLVSFDRFVLNEMIGPAAVGIYGVAYALGRQPIDFVAGPLNNLTVPALFAARAQEGEARAQQMQRGTALTLFILCAAMLAGVFMLRTQIVQLVLKPDFWPDTIWLMPAITAASCLIIFKMYLYDNIFYLYGRTALKLKIAVPVGIVSLALTLLLIWKFALAGAAAALFIGAALALAGSIWGSRTFFRFDFPLRDAVFVTALVAVASLALYGATLLARPLGVAGEIAAGFAAFCAVYAVGLRLLGISLRRMVATPWAPREPG
jgi:O-antigen/teichoic acid export membrane protein